MLRHRQEVSGEDGVGDFIKHRINSDLHVLMFYSVVAADQLEAQAHSGRTSPNAAKPPSDLQDVKIPTKRRIFRKVYSIQWNVIIRVRLAAIRGTSVLFTFKPSCCLCPGCGSCECCVKAESCLLSLLDGL